MAISKGEPVRTAFGRPMSSRADDTVGLRWMFLLVVLVGLMGARLAASGLEENLGASDRAVRLLGYGEPQRVRSGYVPGETQQAEAAVEAASPAAVGLAPAPVTAPTVLPTAVPLPTATAQPSSTGMVRVVNTDGLGVVLHTAPRKDARVPRGFLEGATLIVLERAGDQWARVRGENGQEGWVSAEYLAPVN